MAKQVKCPRCNKRMPQAGCPACLKVDLAQAQARLSELTTDLAREQETLKKVLADRDHWKAVLADRVKVFNTTIDRVKKERNALWDKAELQRKRADALWNRIQGEARQEQPAGDHHAAATR